MVKFRDLACVAAAGLVIALAAGPSAAQSLADTMVAAYRNSNLLEQNRAVLRAADEDVATAVANLRPVMNWALSAGYQNSQGGSGSAGGATTTTGTREVTSASFEISASLTLYDFGRSRLGIDIAKETVLATRDALLNVESDVLLTAVIAYNDVRSAVERVAINENSVRVIGEELQAAEDRFEVGEVTQTDVSLAEARLAAARASLAAAEGQLDAAREAYRAATGGYPGQLAAPPPPPALPASLDAARTTAQRLHPSVLQAQRQVTISELQVAAAAADRLPTLSGSASAGVSESSTSNDRSDSVGVNLSLSQTIYSGGRLPALHRRAIAARDQSRAVLLQTGLILAQEVAVSWSNIDVARAQIVAIEEQIRAATVAYEGVREEAMLGARTTLDVLDAEQELLNARADRIDAEANLQVAIYSLLSSMGLLTVERLNLGIPTYDPAAYYNAVRNAPSSSVQGESLDRILRAIGRE